MPPYNINIFKQLNINQMFDKIQMILMMKTSISNNRMSLLNKVAKKLNKIQAHVLSDFINTIKQIPRTFTVVLK